MTIYEVDFEDGKSEQVFLLPIATEAFRLAHGGQSNVEMALEQASSSWPGRVVVSIRRAINKQVIWRRGDATRPAQTSQDEV